MRASLLLPLLLTVGPLSAAAQSRYIDDCGLETPEMANLPPVPTRPYESILSGPQVVRRQLPGAQRIGGVPTARFTATGALSGKTIYVSPGHGFTWTQVGTGFVWTTQRGNTFSIVEDLVSVETMSQYLIPMLQNAGAQVFPLREIDLNTSMLFVDDGETGYRETGSGFSTSSLMGWGRVTPPLDGSVNPFAAGANRLMTPSATVTASATYTASVPSDGFYTVSISYTAFSGRVRDAHYVVRHAGGDSHFRINQRSKGGTWVLLGRFYFKASQPAVVRVDNDSADVSSNISLDAVKIGGGMGVIDRGGGLSTRPRFEESSRYWAQFTGAPGSVYAPVANAQANDRNNDPSARPRLAAWLNEPSDDAVYVAWHTNSSDGTARGTQTYVYGTQSVNTCSLAANYAGVTGSRELGDFIRNELINDLRASAGWGESTWRDYGTRCANFAEVNPNNNSEMPAVLMEIAFHDNTTDADRLKEPKFRYIAARAMAQGITRYFANKDGVPAHFAPEPPSNLSARNVGNGSALISWSAAVPDGQGVGGEAAASYRLYSSDDGLSWDEGAPVTGTSVTVTLPQVAPKFFRVSAINAGGESFPSAVVGAKARQPGQPLALVVNGFDRLDASMGKLDNLTSFSLGTVVRIFVQRMNDGSTVRRYGDALNANTVPFDSVSSETLAANPVTITSYNLLIWAAGRGHEGGAAPTMAEQNLMRAAQTAGVPLLFSGNATQDTAFMTSVLRVGLGTGTTGLTATGAGVLAGINGITLDDGSRGGYDIGTPWVASPQSGAASLATFGSGAIAGAGVPGQVAVLSFPFEGVVSQAQRIEILNRLLNQVITPSGSDGGFVADGGVEPDAGVDPVDAGEVDGGAVDDAGVDAGQADAGEVDAGRVDGGATDVDGGIPAEVLSFSGGGLGCAAPGDIGGLWALVALALWWRQKTR